MGLELAKSSGKVVALVLTDSHCKLKALFYEFVLTLPFQLLTCVCGQIVTEWLISQVIPMSLSSC